MMRARVARLCLPGPMWFIAVCEGCKWMGLSWKDKGWAVAECTRHNLKEHVAETAGATRIVDHT